MAIDIAEHPLLNDEAECLEPAELAAWALGAEYTLCFNGTNFAGEDLEAARFALVLTVNASVLHEKAFADGDKALIRERKGDQEKQWSLRSGGDQGSKTFKVPSQAQVIADALLGPIGTAMGTDVRWGGPAT